MRRHGRARGAGGGGGGAPEADEAEVEAAGTFVVDARHLFVVHPDMLIAPTSITESVGCERRAALKASMGGGACTARAAVLGNLKVRVLSCRSFILVTSHLVSPRLAPSHLVVYAPCVPRARRVPCRGPIV